jgi:hypothetical protein
VSSILYRSIIKESRSQRKSYFNNSMRAIPKTRIIAARIDANACLALKNITAPNEIAHRSRPASGNIMSHSCDDEADGHTYRIIEPDNFDYLCAAARGLRSINAGVAFL